MRIYTLTDEHRARLPEWRDRWIANAMSTRAMDDEDRAKTIAGLKGMYEAAGLPWHGRVVFVSSPMVLRFAGGFAAAIWHMRKTGFAPRCATRDAIDSATNSATRSATLSATSRATASATESATASATRSATDSLRSWYTGINADEMRHLSDSSGLGSFGLDCARDTYRMWMGGNQWSAWASYLSFFRHVANLADYGVDYSKWAHWEDVVTHAGPCILHPDFCMVSDRPALLTVDAENRPHNDTGPFCRWRDGVALYMVHGVECPAWVIEHPERITTKAIDAETNAELRRVMIDRYGVGRYLAEVGTVIDDGQDETGQPLTLYRRDVPDDEPIVMLRMLNSTPDADGTRRAYMRRVPPDLTSVDQWRAVLHPSKHAAVPAALRVVKAPNVAIEARNWVCRMLPGSRIDVQT